MAKILQGIQDDNPKADPLTEVTSVEDGEDEVTYAECGITGILKAHQRKVKKVPAPTNAEQLRFATGSPNMVFFAAVSITPTSSGYQTWRPASFPHPLPTFF